MACSCTYYDVLISSADLLDATGNSSFPDNTVYVAYIDCNEIPLTKSYTVAGNFTNDICVSAGTSYSVYYYKNDLQTLGMSNISNTSIDCCPTPTPTPTLTETPTPNPTSTPTETSTNTPSNTPTYSVTPTESQTPTPTPTLTETPTQTPTIPITPSSTPTPTIINCGEGVTTTSFWYYYSCCGTFVSGTDIGVTVIFDYNASFAGISKTNVPVSVICPSPSSTPTYTPTPTLTSGLVPSATPTTTCTPTLTITPSKTPGISPVFRLANNCETFTSFPLGVSCQTIVQPTGANGLNGSLRIRISGGTPPYSVYWSNGAKSQILTGLNAGSYEAIVTDFYGDYTATTICTLVGVSPTPTTTITPTVTPTPSPVYSQLCLLILSNTTSFTPLQFIFSGIINSKPSWTSGSYVMAWSNTTNRWEIQGYIVFGGILVSTTTSIPPLSNWTLIGGTQTVTANVVTGTCPAYSPFNATVSKSDSDCTNNGSITINPSGGVPPYLYSNNGGLSFQPSNIFNSLSPQTYSVVVKDSVNNQSNSSTTILLVGSTQTYTLSLVNTQTQNLSTGIRRVYWQVSVSPAIPVGTTIPFVLNIESIQDVSQPGSGSISSTSVVYVSGIPVAESSNNSSSATTVKQGCSPNTTTTTTVIQKYNLTLNSSNTISGFTTSNLNISDPQTSANGCITTVSQNINLFITQATAVGCNCCIANYSSSSTAGIIGHELSAGQGGGSQIYFPIILGLSTSPAGACSNLTLGITRTMNSSAFGPGVSIFTGNPTNPQLAVGFTYVADPYGIIYDLNNGVVSGSTGVSC